MPFVYVTTPLTIPQTFAVGVQSSYAIGTNGNVYSVGNNDFGQLGIGNTTDKTSWTDTGRSAVAIKACKSSSFNWQWAMAWDGTTLYSTGYNVYGNLGVGDFVQKNSFTSTGVTITGFDDFSLGVNHAAILKNGTVWVCGRDNFGQLGIAGTGNQSSFVDTGVSATKVVCAGWSTHIIKDGTVWSCGRNAYGQCALGTTTATVDVFTDSGFVADDLFAGGEHLFAVSNNSLYAVGYNGAGQLGLGDTTNRSSFTDTGIDLTTLKMHCGFSTSFIIPSNGIIQACGENANGTLGLGSYASPITSFTSTGQIASDVWGGLSTTLAETGTGFVGTGVNSESQMPGLSTATRNTFGAISIVP